MNLKKRNPEKPFFSWMGWSMLQKCPRQWFLHNYGRDLPGSGGRAILAERRLSYWSAFAGQLADDGITYLIRSYKRTGKWPEDVDQWLHKQALEYVRESKAFAQAFETNRDLPYVNHKLPRFLADHRPTRRNHGALGSASASRSADSLIHHCRSAARFEHLTTKRSSM